MNNTKSTSMRVGLMSLISIGITTMVGYLPFSFSLYWLSVMHLHYSVDKTNRLQKAVETWEVVAMLIQGLLYLTLLRRDINKESMEILCCATALFSYCIFMGLFLYKLVWTKYLDCERGVDQVLKRLDYVKDLLRAENISVGFYMISILCICCIFNITFIKLWPFLLVICTLSMTSYIVYRDAVKTAKDTLLNCKEETDNVVVLDLKDLEEVVEDNESE